MENMIVNIDVNDDMVCDPATLHVPKFSREDILLILHDDIVDTWDFAKGNKAIIFDNGNHARRFSEVRLNDKTLWLHDDNTEHHNGKENAKFTITITEIGGADRELDPQVINE